MTDSQATLLVRVVPNAKRDGFAGYHGEAMRIRLRAPAVEGKANRALIDFLAKSLAVPRSSISLASGEKSREKRLAIAGLTPRDLEEKLSAIAPDQPRPAPT